MAEKEMVPSYARDIDVLKEMFVTQRQFKEFSDELYKHISAQGDSIVRKLDNNREVLSGELQAQRVEFSQLKDEVKVIAITMQKSRKRLWRYGKIVGGLVAAGSSIVWVIYMLFELHVL